MNRTEIKKRLENWADSVNLQFDPERLRKPKPLNLVDLIDDYDIRLMIWRFKESSKCLGMTFFDDGILETIVDDEESRLESEEIRRVPAKSICINKKYFESPNDSEKFMAVFTMAHEFYHMMNHAAYFRSQISHCHTYDHASYEEAQNDVTNRLYWIEADANFGARYLLLPKQAVQNAVKCFPTCVFKNGKIVESPISKAYLKDVGHLFNVNYTTLVYRLNELNLMDIPLNWNTNWPSSKLNS